MYTLIIKELALGIQSYEVKDSLGYWLARSARLLNYDFEQRIKRYKVTRVGYCILNCIDKKSGSNPCEIAEYLNLDRAAVSRCLDKLESEAMIQRSQEDGDRRWVKIALTGRGRKVLAKLIEGSITTNDHLATLLSEPELRELRRMLEKIGTAGFSEGKGL